MSKTKNIKKDRGAGIFVDPEVLEHRISVLNSERCEAESALMQLIFANPHEAVRKHAKLMLKALNIAAHMPFNVLVRKADTDTAMVNAERNLNDARERSKQL